MKHRLLTLLITLGSLWLTSCGLIDMEFDPYTQTVTNVKFAYDTVYVMQGDTFFLAPYIEPDSVSNETLYMESEHDSIVSVQSDTIIAMGEGETHLIAVSASQSMTDTCLVMVMQPWRVSPYDHLYDMVIYADIDLGKGLYFNPSIMDVAAFRNGTCIGKGETIEMPDGKRYTRFRCWTNTDPEESDPEDFIYFMIHYKMNLQIGFFEQTIPFDGKTHGTLSNLVKLTLTKY